MRERSTGASAPQIWSWSCARVARASLTTAVLYYLVLAGILFLPFLVLGRPVLAGTDNVIHFFPNFLFSLRAFQHGELGLWNPYIYCGVNFSASPQNLIYYPINWLIFACPERWMFVLLSARMFVETWAVGVFAFLFFCEELGDRPAALLAATAYQLCGFLVFGITAYAGLTIYALVTLAVYLVYTLHRRREWVSFVGLAGLVAGIILCNNPLYGLAALFHLGIVTVYRFCSFSLGRSTRWADLRLLAAGFVVGLLIAAVQWLPFLHGLISEGTRVGGIRLEALPGSVYFGLTALVPEVMAVSYKTSFPWLQTLLQRMDMHAQNHGLDYFGALPLILVIWSGLRPRRRTVFWLVYLATAVAWYLRISPVADVLNLLCYPFLHEIVARTMIPLPFCVLAGHAARRLGEDPARLTRRDMGVIVLLLSAGIMSALAFLALGRPAEIPALQAGARLLLLVFAGLGLAWRRWPGALKSGGAFVPAAVAAVSALAVLAAAGGGGTSLDRLGVLWAAGSVLGVSICWLALNLAANPSRRRGALYLLGALIAAGLVAGVALPSSWVQGVLHPGFAALFAWGIARVAVVAGCTFAALAWARAGRLGASGLMVVCLAVTLLDLVPHNLVYNHIITDPFMREAPYPRRDDVLAGMDLADYRVNVPDVYLGLRAEPLYYSNEHVFYGIRAPGGLNSDMPRRHAVLGEAFNRLAEGADVRFQYDRFMDLVGVGYDSNSRGERLARTTALSRMMWFTGFEVGPDDPSVLARLADPEWDPRNRLILNQAPLSLDPGTGEHSPARRLDYKEVWTSRLEVALPAGSAAGLVFFGDSFHPDWRAWVDGHAQPVWRANYKFMAVAVPANARQVVFEFRPRMFALGRVLTFLGLMLFVLLSVKGMMRMN